MDDCEIHGVDSSFSAMRHSNSFKNQKNGDDEKKNKSKS